MSQAPEDQEQSRRAARRRSIGAPGLENGSFAPWASRRPRAILVVLVFWLGGRFFGKHEAAVGEAPSPPGTFRATAPADEDLHHCARRHARLRQRGIDRGQDRSQRRSGHSVVLSLLGPRDPGDRGSRRYGQKGRATRDDRGVGVRPGPERSRYGRRTGQARAHQRGPQARAVRGQGRQPARLAASADGSHRGGDRRCTRYAIG